uniref:lebercilin n=1 Tax=Euleptes europaea TaxID=460621 RepID=UPI002540F016|nr:lebercilin [Euleptes europaea]
MDETGSSLDSEKNKKSDDKSCSCYLGDSDSCASDYSPTLLSTQSTNSGESHKAQNLKSFVHCEAFKHTASRYVQSKKGFCSQSLIRDSPSKDINLVTKQVLSTRLLKHKEYRNEVTELRAKLDEVEKENSTLKQLQRKCEKALRKYEDTENEISQLVTRHDNEIRVLKEHLRKSQEKVQTSERKLKSSQEELYKAKSALQKLRRLAEEKHLPERKELAKKVALLESQLDDNNKRIKDLERNLGLTTNSLQRELNSQKKKTHEFEERNNGLQEEIKRLSQKVKDTQRQLDATNIYAYRRMAKPTASITPRKKAVNGDTIREEQTANGAQTSGYFSPVEFPPPPDFISDPVSQENKEDVHIKMEEIVKKEWKEQGERFRQEQIREKEERLKRDQELQAVEETAKKFRDEWKREDSERRKKENSLLMERQSKAKMETEIYILENEMQNSGNLEERRRKEMYEFDRDIKKQQKVEGTGSSYDVTFGSYVPSFAKGSRRPSWLNKKSDNLEETSKENVGLHIKSDKKANLMKQLFGSTASVDASSKTNDFDFFDQDSSPDGFP